MMSIAESIRTFMRETFFVEEFEDDASFLRTGLVDSTGMIELITFLQSAFEIEIADSELVPDNLDSLSKVCSFVERKRDRALEEARACAQ